MSEGKKGLKKVVNESINSMAKNIVNLRHGDISDKKVYEQEVEKAELMITSLCEMYRIAYS